MNSLNNDEYSALLNMKDEYNFELIIDYLHCKKEEEKDNNYEKQFPKVFYLEDYDSKISQIIEKLYGFVKENTYINMLIQHMNQQHNIVKPNDCEDNNLLGFMMLFCFDYFQFIHQCLQDIYKYNKISDNCIEIIKNKMVSLK